MRVISSTTEREADCGCGARLSFWPADVTSETHARLGPDEPDTGAIVIHDTFTTRGVRCPCCLRLVEVDHA